MGCTKMKLEELIAYGSKEAIIENLKDAGSSQLLVRNCAFDGPADGESAFKECRQIEVEDCFFNLRYPFWHDHGLTIRHSELTENCRAALWYSDHVTVTDSKLHGIKAFRECADVTIQNCDIISPEFGW